MNTFEISSMSWAANEWKDGLPHRALQKIAEYEGQLERFKKELSQKEFQLDGLKQVFSFANYGIRVLLLMVLKLL